MAFLYLSWTSTCYRGLRDIFYTGKLACLHVLLHPHLCAALNPRVTVSYEASGNFPWGNTALPQPWAQVIHPSDFWDSPLLYDVHPSPCNCFHSPELQSLHLSSGAIGFSLDSASLCCRLETVLGRELGSWVAHFTSSPLKDHSLKLAAVHGLKKKLSDVFRSVLEIFMSRSPAWYHWLPDSWSWNSLCVGT